MKITTILDRYLFEHVEENCLAYQRQADACKPLRIELGHLEPGQLQAPAIKTYKQNRAKGATNGRRVRNATIRRELITLTAALNYAAGQTWIAHNAWPKIALPPSSDPKDLWLTLREEEQFLELAATFDTPERMSRIHRFVAIALDTAARKNSIQTLMWTMVCFERRVIEFQKGGGRQKNKKRVQVPISDRLLPILKRAYEERTSEYVLDSPYTIRHHFKKLIELAREKLGDKFAKVTPHSLRHTSATLMAQNGVDLRAIAGVLGNSQAVVDKTYAHHCPEHLRAAVNYRNNDRQADTHA